MSSELPDADLQKLFRRQGTARSPADLDQRILAAASQSVRQENRAGEAGGSGGKSRYRMLALIALLVISVALLVMLYDYQRNSETTRQSRAIMSERLAPQVKKPPADSPIATSPRTREQHPLPNIPTSATSEAGTADVSFRSNPALWFKEIQQLDQQGRSSEAAFERKLFDSVHPGYSAQ
ncbi:MAG: hypothetical protein KDJ38_02045 [Gammaproteobacteria bacterium]|nr:hypothetical protein [Gammaproteobacteria bacterium]